MIVSGTPPEAPQIGVAAPWLDFRERDVYDILVSLAGATDDESNRAQFHHFWRDRRDLREYRFIGELGFGGKFYCSGSGHNWRVDCYPEDLTPYRKDVINETNSALATLEVDTP